MSLKWLAPLPFFALFLTVAYGESPNPSESFGLKGEELRHRDYMVEISRHLGVTCTHCHDVKNFKKNKMPNWITAKQHIEVVESLNNENLKKLGIKKADCYLCHRGKAKPDYIEKVKITD
jgi:hypothetical protein